MAQVIQLNDFSPAPESPQTSDGNGGYRQEMVVHVHLHFDGSDAPESEPEFQPARASAPEKRAHRWPWLLRGLALGVRP